MGLKKVNEAMKEADGVFHAAAQTAVTTSIIWDPEEDFSINADGTFNVLEASRRNEYEIKDVNDAYIKKGLMKARMLKGFWSDAGTFESLYKVAKWVKERSEGQENAQSRD